MISFLKFTEYMRKEQEKRLKGRLAIEIRHGKGNNGVPMTCLSGERSGKRNGNSGSFMVDLDSCYRVYKGGLTLEQIANDIYDLFNTFEKSSCSSMDLGDFEQIKDKIVYKLVNYDRNLEMLKEIPHIPCLDWAITFHLIGDRNEKGQSVYPIRHRERLAWGKDIGTLYELAKENTPKLFPVFLCSMEQLLKGGANDLKGKSIEPDPYGFLYVLGNQVGLYGAASVLYEHVLKDFASRMETDLVLLPSSIHEVLILPYSEPLDIKQVQGIVEQVNGTEVPEEYFLSNHVYLYDREKDKISII